MNKKPTPVFSETVTYDLHDISEYINWIYFFHSWNFQPKFASVAELDGCPACNAAWVDSFSEEERNKASEAMKLYKDALSLMRKHDGDFKIKVKYNLYRACSDMDDIVIEKYRIPFLRQQKPEPGKDYCLCLADFLPDIESGKTDMFGVFATTVDKEMENAYHDDLYNRMIMQVLAERAAEAATEKCHEYIRKKTWGYAPSENLSIKEMLVEKYDGIRPAVGYPSIPDNTINFIIDDLLDFSEIGLEVTENGAMKPLASVSGFMFSNPHSRYFSIGKITAEQLDDYAKRRGKSPDELSKFLSKNIEKL